MPPTIHDVAKDINTVLSRHGMRAVADARALTPTDNSFTERLDNEPVSNELFDHYMPPVSTPANLLHFTGPAAFESILRTHTLRLTSPLKRLKEHEYKDFYRRHGLSGYSPADPNTGEPGYVSMMRNLFYISLTTPAERSNPQMWKHFADDSRGACLHLRVAPVLHRAHLRKIVYGPGNDPQMPGLVELNAELQSKHSRFFVPARLSRMGAFCLPTLYSNENERRLLIKKFEGDGLAPMGPDNGPWIEVPLMGGNDYASVELVGVTPGKRLGYCAAWRTLRRAGFGRLASTKLLKCRGT